jgi:hypothetical protein
MTEMVWGVMWWGFCVGGDRALPTICDKNAAVRNDRPPGPRARTKGGRPFLVAAQLSSKKRAPLSERPSAHDARVADLRRSHTHQELFNSFLKRLTLPREVLCRLKNLPSAGAGFLRRDRHASDVLRDILPARPQLLSMALSKGGVGSLPWELEVAGRLLVAIGL